MIFKRPWLVLLLFIFSLVFTVSAAARVWNGVQFYWFLDDLSMSVSPLYLVITGVVWSILGAATAIMVWWGNSLAKRVLISGTLLYSVFFWFEQLFLMSNPLRKTNWLFLVILTLIVFLVEVLSFQHPRVRKFFGGLA